MTAAFQAPSGAQTSTAAPGARNLVQVICTQLLRTPLDVIAGAVGCDVSGASRVRAGERACNLNGWLALMDVLGYKLVNKSKLCMEADEARMLRRAYSFITSSDELSARFAASLEAVPLKWDGDE